MRRQMTSFSLMVCGVIALTLGLTVAPTPTPAAAMPRLQPSPRPTLVPPMEEPPREERRDPTPVPFGRVTGTVIDARTGAPVADRLVVIGDSIVVTDANGNYDRWVGPGSYSVGLQLRDGEGVPTGGMQTVAIEPGATTVLHLFYTSPAPVVAVEPTPTAAPVEPTLAAEPSVVAEQPEQPIVEAAVAPRSPTKLPHTAVGDVSVPGPFVLVGALLFGLGVLLQARPRRRAAARAKADSRALRRMLSSPPKRTAEETLEELLRQEP